MARLDFVSNLRPGRNPGRARFALLASLVLHGAAFGSVLALAIFCGMHLPLVQAGSAPGSISLSLEKSTVVPAPPPVPQPAKPFVRHDAVAIPMPTESKIAVEPLIQGVAVLAPITPAAVKSFSPAGIKKPPHIATIRSVSPEAVKPAVAVSSGAPSSYAPGREDLPHPPYPIEARDGRKTGTVIMNVQFDAQGSVTQARVWRSSGVLLLDSETMSFIRANWHSSTYAGQTINVPVEYKLQQL